MKKSAIWIIVILVLIVCLAIGMVVMQRKHQKENTYQHAIQAVQAGDVAQAYQLFQELGDYRDAEQEAAALFERDSSLPYATAKKGDTVFFGHWEQDGDLGNGSEPIEWIVLDKIDGQLLLLSASCLEGITYNTESFTPVTWETCSLRRWLNEDFFSQAFTEAERTWIPSVVNENPAHSVVGTPGGQDTVDQVFILCERDTVIYLKNDADRLEIGRAPATQAAVANGLQANEEGYASWWLRSPGMYDYIAQFVDQNGTPYINGASTDIDYMCGVRPAIWLDVKGGRP